MIHCLEKQMANKWYVVYRGRSPGIYNDWTLCQEQVDGFSGSSYVSFKTREEAVNSYATYKARCREEKKAKNPDNAIQPSKWSFLHGVVAAQAIVIAILLWKLGGTCTC